MSIQNDRVYPPLGSQKRQVSAERLLRTRSTFSKSVIVSVAVSILGTTKLMFIEPGVKINGAYYRVVLLGQQLPAGDSFRSKRLLHFQCSSSPSWWHRWVFVSQYTRFYIIFAVAAQQPWTKSHGLWGVGRAPATRLPQQDSRRRPVETASHRGVALLRPEHYWQSSWTVTCSTTRVCPCKRRPLWAQTVTDVFVYELLSAKATFRYWKLLFLSSIFRTAVAQKLCGGFCWNLQRLRRKDDN